MNTRKNNQKSRAKWCLELYLTFAKLGLFTFGGGYAMIPLMQRELVETKKWIADEELLDIIAVAESTPGPIALNSATFIGSKKAGALGAFCATMGVVTPSYIIIMIISMFLRSFSEIEAVQYAFLGIRAGVLALILRAVVTMAKKCPKQTLSYIAAGIAFCAVALFGANVLIVIAAAAVLGIIWPYIVKNGSSEKKEESKK